VKPGGNFWFKAALKASLGAKKREKALFPTARAKGFGACGHGVLLGFLLESYGELGLACFLRIVESLSISVGLAGFKVKAMLEAVWESGEASLAIDVGANLKIELVEAAESVGDVHFDGRGIDRLAGIICNGEVGGAGPQTAVDRGDRVGIGSLGKGRGHEQQKQQSSHGETL
jgi:hypothetical protein